MDDCAAQDIHPAGRSISVWVVIRLAIALGFVAVLALQWQLIDWLTPFLLIPLIWFLGALSIAAFGWELIMLLRRPRRWRNSWRAAMILACGVAALTVPFTDIWLEWYFDSYQADREKVVEMIKSGKLAPNVLHNPRLIALPPDSPGVSMGGNEVLVEGHDGGKYVFFFTYRGILDNYSGFLYVPDGGDPRRFADLGEEKTTQLVPVRGRWVYAAHW